MNKQRRARIAKVQAAIEVLLEELEEIRDEEQEAYDNFPESLQESERGEAMIAAIDNLDYAMESIGEVVDYLENAAD